MAKEMPMRGKEIHYSTLTLLGVEKQREKG